MSKIDALDIWRKISMTEICKETLGFYNQTQLTPKGILKRGSADFDKKATSNSGEKAHYRAVYYMSTDGYMDMHIKQNLVSNNTYLSAVTKGNSDILFVDFGCGPMTAGLTAAESFSKHDHNYKERVFYAGIDISKNMRILAEGINLKFKLFDGDRFCLSENLAQLAGAIDFEPNIIILSLSYVLSPNTLNTISATSLANEWHNLVENLSTTKKVYVIYHNPHGNFHENWDTFKNHLKQLSLSGRLKYADGQIRDCNWGERRPSAMAMITGTKEAES